MLLQAINLDVAKRVKTDLIIGADNQLANLDRTGGWAQYAQPSTRGRLDWSKCKGKKKRGISFDIDFSDDNPGIEISDVDLDDYKKVAVCIIFAYTARAGRCFEYSLLALFYWLLAIEQSWDTIFWPGSYYLCELSEPFDHQFLLVHHKAMRTHYFCDPWLNIVECAQNEVEFQNILDRMRRKLIEHTRQWRSRADEKGSLALYDGYLSRNADDPKVKNNRVALLWNLRILLNSVADLSRL
jgi:hypothetical protein